MNNIKVKESQWFKNSNKLINFHLYENDNKWVYIVVDKEFGHLDKINILDEKNISLDEAIKIAGFNRKDLTEINFD